MLTIINAKGFVVPSFRNETKDERMHVSGLIDKSIHIGTHVGITTCVSVRIHVYIYIHAHTHTYMYAHIHIYTYI